jgi:MtrB/PioB family decaheme-associated outer membrane protein
MRVSVLALAVEGALLAMCTMPAYAVDDEVAALIMPTNFVEMGASYTSDTSNKFGEYNGLNDDGAHLIGNFSVRGGDAYGDGNGTSRWSLYGTDVGLDSRGLGATVSDQGRWNLGINYDELRHNTTTGYQTPYAGAVGGNSFTLPGALDPTTVTNAMLHTLDVSNKRQNTTINGGYYFNPNLQLTVDYNHLDMSGAKLMSFGGIGENTVVLPNPTESKTDTVNVALNWRGDRGFATGAYYGSFYRNDYNGVTWTNYDDGLPNSMSTEPDNNFHQLNLTGGYKFSSQTKLAGGLSYGRNTQDEAYQSYSGAEAGLLKAGYPTQTSLDGLVVNKHADAKLTNTTIKDLTLSAGFKYDERNNRTSAAIYGFTSIGLSAGHTAYYSNTPLSTRKTQYELAGDYRIDQDKHVRVDYNHTDYKRWCDQYAGNGSTGGLAIGTILGADGSCVTSPKTREDKLGATYRARLTDSVNANVGYSYSDRKTHFDPTAITAYIGNINVTRGLNDDNYAGFNPFFEASRTQQVLKAGIDWQANRNLSLGASGRYTDDNYDATLGVQKGNSYALNLDATYAYSSNNTASAYATFQHRERDLSSQRTTTFWTNSLSEDDATLGIAGKQNGLIGGKLELSEDLTYSLGKTDYLNGQSGTVYHCTPLDNYSCGAPPTIKSDMMRFKLTGQYALDKQSKVAVGYLWQRLKADDYFYNAYEVGPYAIGAIMPTNQQSGSYTVNAVFASYLYSFR